MNGKHYDPDFDMICVALLQFSQFRGNVRKIIFCLVRTNNDDEMGVRCNGIFMTYDHRNLLLQMLQIPTEVWKSSNCFDNVSNFKIIYKS